MLFYGEESGWGGVDWCRHYVIEDFLLFKMIASHENP